jgi:4-hydroxy-tetrahydrodipicolinate reductase
MYIGTDEIVTLSHQAESRQVFALGALRAAKFIKDKKVGKYNMNDIIGSDYAVTVISSVLNIALFTITDISFLSFSKILTAIAEKHINVDMISQTMNQDNNVNISFTVESVYSDLVNEIINNLKLNYTTRSKVSKLVIEGAGMEHQYGVADEVIRLLNSIDTKVYAITTSETIIACCVDESKVIESEKLLKTHYGVKI